MHTNLHIGVQLYALTDDVGERHDVVLGEGERLDLGQLSRLVHVGNDFAEALKRDRKGTMGD